MAWTRYCATRSAPENAEQAQSAIPTVTIVVCSSMFVNIITTKRLTRRLEDVEEAMGRAAFRLIIVY